MGGLACAEFPRGVEFRGSLAPFFFSTSLKKKEDEGTRRQEEEEKREKRDGVKSNLFTRYESELFIFWIVTPLKNQWTLELFQQFFFSNAFSIYSKPAFVIFVV